MKYLKNSFSLVVVFIVLMIIIPLPSFLLDTLLIINISLSLMILLTTMYIKDALEFSIFPSILLITTLFRLSLNISSTRLILGHGGNAGKVIKTFGEFVIGSNAVVGFIIFIIIVIVQFIVITKGAERVAEVSARFTLDAMPGKQMAIDADLNSGAIDEKSARKRRINVQREADFYGAMDGASKFVKGDAIISIIVAFINLIGGAVIGLVNGGDFTSVLSTYTIATVGDGLVSQIPALMISTAMGMIVTRSASEDNLNTDLKNQFTSQPFVLMLAGIVITAMVIIPGFPKIPLIAVGGALIWGSTYLNKNKKLEAIKQQTDEMVENQKAMNELEYYKDIDNVYKLISVEPIEMEFGYSLIPLADEVAGGTFIERVVLFRKQFAVDMGMVIPSIRMKDNQNINPNQYVIKIKGEEVARADILTDHYLALDSGHVEKVIDGIDTVEPAFNIPAKWIREDQKVAADVAGYTLIDPTSVMITHLSEVIRTHAHELLSRQDVKTMLDKVKQTDPAIVDDVIPNVISSSFLQHVLVNLLKEGIPIRDLPTILECLCDHANKQSDIDLTTEYVRQSLKRTITRKYSEGGQLRVITVDSDIEDKIVTSVKTSDQGSYLALDPVTVQTLVGCVKEQIEKVKDIIPNPVILTSPVVRVYLKKLLDQFSPGITVLSFGEIENTVTIQSIGNIKI